MHRIRLRMESKGDCGVYRLGDVVDHNGTVGVAVVHGGERLVALLSGRVPEVYVRAAPATMGDGKYQISNLTVVVSSRAMVWVRKAAPIVLSR